MDTKVWLELFINRWEVLNILYWHQTVSMLQMGNIRLI